MLLCIIMLAMAIIISFYGIYDLDKRLQKEERKTTSLLEMLIDSDKHNSEKFDLLLEKVKEL